MGLTNGILTAPFTKIAANGSGDLQVALERRNIYSHIQLIGDVNESSVAVNKINKWSKHKPFDPLTAAANYPFDSSGATPELRSPNRWAAALAVDFGLSIPLFQTAAAFHNGWMTDWEYVKPTSNYRALDFDGYATVSYLLSATGLDLSVGKRTDANFMRFPMGGALMLPDPYNVTNGHNSFPTWINQHESDNCILAPSDFAGATGNNNVVNGTRVDLSKMFFGLALLYRESVTNPQNYGKVWLSDEALTTTGQIGCYPSDLDVGNNLGMYYLVPILCSDASITKNTWMPLTSVSGYICSIDGYGMAISIVTSVTEITIKAGYSTTQSTQSAAKFNFSFRNALTAAALVEELRCYVIAEATYQDSDYATTFSDLRDDMAVGQDPKANVVVNNKIVARYFNIISSLSSTTLAMNTTYTFLKDIGAVQDGLGNPYNVLSCVLLFIKYKSPTNATTSTMQMRELYYRNGNIITD